MFELLCIQESNLCTLGRIAEIRTTPCNLLCNIMGENISAIKRYIILQKQVISVLLMYCRGRGGGVVETGAVLLLLYIRHGNMVKICIPLGGHNCTIMICIKIIFPLCTCLNCIAS